MLKVYEEVFDVPAVAGHRDLLAHLRQVVTQLRIVLDDSAALRGLAALLADLDNQN